MSSAPAYRVDQAYQPYLHRELTVSWLLLATLLGGRHRLELPGAGFNYLEFGCGYGLNLLFNAAAYPEAHFHGIDLYPSHVAEAQAWARELGLSNVSFAVEDLRNFVDGPPRQGPCRDWPAQHEIVVAHGVATWVGEAERTALIRAASSLLVPGGLLYCSYNTFPGWLSRNPLNMLSLEHGRRQGSNTNADAILKAVGQLEALIGNEQGSLPLGRAFPQLQPALKELRGHTADYLAGEYHAGHQPVYVSAMHRLCTAHGLSHVGSASLPEPFTELLDPERRAVVEQAEDASLRETLFDLAICQSFRRDLFAKGVRRPAGPWRRQALASLLLRPGTGPLASCSEFRTTLGTLQIEPAFCAALENLLAGGGQRLGDLESSLGWSLEEILPRLAVLIDKGLVEVAEVPGVVSHATAEQVNAFNDRALNLISSGAPLGGVLSPALLQPVPLAALDAFFTQVVNQGFQGEEAASLVAMGLAMAGVTLNDGQGMAIEGDAAVLAHLTAYWQEYAGQRLQDLRRTGVLAP